MRKNLRKLFCWAMAFILILGLLGCQDTSPGNLENETEPGVVETEASTEEATEAVTEAATEAPADSDKLEEEDKEDAAGEVNEDLAPNEDAPALEEGLNDEVMPTKAAKDTSSKDTSKDTSKNNAGSNSSTGSSSSNNGSGSSGNSNNSGNAGGNTGNNNAGGESGTKPSTGNNSSNSSSTGSSGGGSTAATTPPSTEPPATEPPATEPAGCDHDWQEVWHPEEGHYGDHYCKCACGARFNNEAEWRTHTKTVPGEDLINHLSWHGTSDWIVDSPEYTEWVCSKCGKTKD